MDPKAFVAELSASNEKLLTEIGELKVLAQKQPESANNLTGLLRIALANEISR